MQNKLLVYKGKEEKCDGENISYILLIISKLLLGYLLQKDIYYKLCSFIECDNTEKSVKLQL